MEQLITEFLSTLIWLFRPLTICPDYWSVVHLWSGIILWACLSYAGIKRKWAVLLFLLIFWEIIEQGGTFERILQTQKRFVFAENYEIFLAGLHESNMDIFSDILIGMSGGLGTGWFLQRHRAHPDRTGGVLILSAFTTAFISMGPYGGKSVLGGTLSAAACLLLFRAVNEKRKTVPAFLSMCVLFLFLWTGSRILVPAKAISPASGLAFPFLLLGTYLFMRELFAGCVRQEAYAPEFPYFNKKARPRRRKLSLLTVC